MWRIKGQKVGERLVIHLHEFFADSIVVRVHKEFATIDKAQGRAGEVFELAEFEHKRKRQLTQPST